MLAQQPLALQQVARHQLHPHPCTRENTACRRWTTLRRVRALQQQQLIQHLVLVAQGRQQQVSDHSTVHPMNTHDQARKTVLLVLVTNAAAP